MIKPASIKLTLTNFSIDPSLPFKTLTAAGIVALAILAGLAPIVLGFDSAASVIIFCAILLAVIAFFSVVISAAKGNQSSLVVFLALSVFLIDATFRQRALTAQSIDAQTLMKFIVWICAMVIALSATPKFFTRLFQGDMKWISFVALLAFFSTLYSLTPAYTFGGGVAAIAYCALAVCVTETLRKEQILYGFLAGLTLLLVLSLLMYAVGGGMAAMEGGAILRLGGLAGSPNSLGRAASLSLLLVGVLLIYGQLSIWSWKCWMPVTIALACLVLSDSRTSVAVILIAFTLYYLRRHPLMALLGCLSMTLAGFLLLNMDLSFRDFAVSFSRSGRASDLMTLTGRTDIWAVSFNAFLERPLLGYGFGSTKILLPEIYSTHWGFTVGHAHNLYMQTMVTLGLAGLSLVLIILARQIASYFSKQDVFKTVVLGFILAHGLTEPGPIGVTPNVVTFFWALSLCWDRVLEREAGLANVKTDSRDIQEV